MNVHPESLSGLLIGHALLALMDTMDWRQVLLISAEGLDYGVLGETIRNVRANIRNFSYFYLENN